MAPPPTTTAPAVSGCVTALGVLGSKRVARSGSWTAGSSCLAARRGDAQTPYYAQRFTFTLTADAEVVIGLSSGVDTYLYLLDGHGSKGNQRHSNDNKDSKTRNSRLAVALPKGDYTIDATTFQARAVGTFSLEVSTDIDDDVAPSIDGLKSTHKTTVGADLSFGFGFSPQSAVVSVRSVAPSGLALAVSSGGNMAAVAGTASLAGVYTVVLEASRSGETATAATTVTAACPAGRSEQSDRSCRAAAKPLRVSRLSSDEATVGRWFAAGFGYEPASARVSLGAVDPDGFVPLLSARDGRGRLSGRPRLAGGYEVAVVLEHAGVKKTFKFTVEAECAHDLVELDDRSCNRLSINSLQAEADAVVGKPLVVVFGYSPASAILSVPRARLARDGLRVEVDERAVRSVAIVTLTLTASRAGQWQLRVALSHSNQTRHATVNITAACPAGSAPHTDGTGNCTPTATLPAGCVAAALDSRARNWWGRMITTRVYATPLGDGPSTGGVCASVDGGDTVSYLYSMRVPASLKPTRARITLRTRETNPLVSSLTVWKRIPAGPLNAARVQLVARSRVADGAATPMVESLPGGNYILEIARTTMDLTRGYFTLNVWHPLPERVHADVKRLGNTGLNGAGATLEGFLDARGSLCYGAHPSCPTNNDNPFEPPSIEFPWLPFITDECSIPQGLVEATEKGINLLNTLIRAIANPASLFSRTELVDLAQYLRDHPKFGTQTVSLVFACMRHDFNWRNLYRVEHHLQHEGAWNNTAREQADERFHLDLRRLCDANRVSPPVTPRHYTWRVTDDLIAKCHRVALAMSLGVQANPMLRIKYGSDEV